MKKFLGILIAVIMLATVAFASDITVTLNGEAIDFADQPATIVEGRTLVPLRAIFEALGATVEWDGTTKTVTSSMDDVTIKLTIGENTLYKNGEGVTLDVPAQIINSRTMVPARAIAEAYGVGVEWDAVTRTVVLTKEEKEEITEEIDDNVLFTLSGENFTGSEGYLFTSGGSITPEIVSDFEDENDKVLFLHSTFTEKQAWTYFRNNVTADFVPGERYLVKFRVSAEKNSADNDIAACSVGICLRYADTTETSEVKDHGVATVKSTPGSWTEVNYVFTMPTTAIVEKGFGFGIFSNPESNLPISYYLDDVSVEVYTGSLADGFATAEQVEAAKDAAVFDFDSAKGIVFDYDDSFELKYVTAPGKYIKDGNLVILAEDDFFDPIINHNNLSYSASEYNAIAIRFKADVKGKSGHPKANSIQVYFTTDTDDKLSESKSVSMAHSSCTRDGDWYVAYLYMGSNEYWNGNITALRIDPANDAGTFEIDKFVLIEA